MKRRTKKQRQELFDVIQGSIVIISFVVFYYTRSLTAGFIAFVFLVSLAVSLTFMNKLKRRERLKKSGIHEIDKMDGVVFEHYLKELFITNGYKVEVTKSSGDYGADLILKKENKKIVVQAKRYSKPVGIKAVQEIKAAQNHYKAQEAWVVTNNYFTKAAFNLAKSNNVSLIHRDRLIEMSLNIKNQQTNKKERALP